MPEPETDYKQTYEEFWKELVENPDGSLDKDKVMRELSDYRSMLHEIPLVFSHVTGGMISKPNTHASAVISEHDHLCSKDVEEARLEEREACALAAENEPRVFDADAPDPQHRIAAAIRRRTE